MVTPGRPIYRYVVNESDIIVAVDDWWLGFARENGAPELTRESVVGKVLWPFIVDEPTRTLYREVHAHVRSSGIPVKVPFRCDSPTLQRHMELTIRPDVPHRLLYECTIVRVVPQEYLATLDTDKRRSREFLTMCSLCKRSLVEPSGWLDLENISLTIRWFQQESIPQLRYTVCPECVGKSRPVAEQQLHG
jgi:hypothetical protein